MEIKYKRFARYLQDFLILLILGGLLFCGDLWQMFLKISDPAHYQCYAIAFWQGLSELQKLAPRQCAFLIHPDKDVTLITQDGLLHAMQQWQLPSGLIQFVAAQSSSQPYHSLPLEYPPLMLLPFSLALIVPDHWYQVAFAIEMLLFVGGIYLVLQRWQSRQVAFTYALYLIAGCSSTAVARIDIIPAGLSLFALIYAVQKRWNWAFVLLALAVLSKIYPIILLIPFVLALQRGISGRWYAWRKWLPVALFVGICAFVTTISLILSVVGTLAPLGYFVHRPVEAESLSASILWLLSLLGKTSLTYENKFDALNVLSPLSANVIFLLTVLLVFGLFWIWWLQWRGHIDLVMACLLTLLIVIVTGKVFSPQYLIWIFPLVACMGQGSRWWLFFWIVVGFLTTWIYPDIFVFSMVRYILLVPYLPQFYPATMVRNFLVLGLMLCMLISKSCLYYRFSHHKEQAEYGKQSGENQPPDLLEVE